MNRVNGVNGVNGYGNGWLRSVPYGGYPNGAYLPHVGGPYYGQPQAHQQPAYPSSATVVRPAVGASGADAPTYVGQGTVVEPLVVAAGLLVSLAVLGGAGALVGWAIGGTQRAALVGGALGVGLPIVIAPVVNALRGSST